MAGIANSRYDVRVAEHRLDLHLRGEVADNLCDDEGATVVMGHHSFRAHTLKEPTEAPLLLQHPPSSCNSPPPLAHTPRKERPAHQRSYDSHLLHDRGVRSLMRRDRHLLTPSCWSAAANLRRFIHLVSQVNPAQTSSKAAACL